MECNKEEAIRAREIAEKRMQNKDFVGAQKIALKAQQLYPSLENISQLLTVCEVHISSNLNALGSEMDWYGVLQVPLTADESFIKKQYRKLALLLHPDKNRFPGAEAAFKLIGEAHRVLSDQGKRTLYDIKRRTNVRTAVPRQQPPQPNKNSYKRPGLSQLHQQQTQIPPTFWTICPFCQIKYQHYRTVLNRALRCQNCLQPFIAQDMYLQGGPPGGYAGYQSATAQCKDIPSEGAHQAGQGNVSKGPTVSEPFAKNKTGAEVGSKSQSKATQDGEVNRRTQTGKSARNVSRKRGRKAEVEYSGNCNSEGTDIEDATMKADDVTPKNAKSTSSRYPQRSSRQKQNVTYNENRSDTGDFAKSQSSKRFKRSSSSSGADRVSNGAFSNGNNKIREPASDAAVFEEKKEHEQKGSVSSKEGLPNGEERVVKMESSPIEKKKESSKDRDNSEVKSSISSDPEDESNVNPIAYPEPEFHDFDNDRVQGRLNVDQIWAVYDDADGMPRFYVRIRKIYPHKSRLRITWLEADPRDRRGLDWLAEKLPVACGNFKTGLTEDTEDLLMFSHLASWEKGTARGTYEIYPRRGDIWALFKDWSVQWSSNPDAHRNYGFDFVEVLSDYAEGTEVLVTCLVMLEGFTSLFKPTADMGRNHIRILPNEVLRFSHRVPCYRMTGGEREGVPAGAFELDPASVFTAGFSPSIGVDKVFNKCVDVESNTVCSKPGTEKETPSTGPKKLNTFEESRDLTEKNIQSKENFDYNRCSKSETAKEIPAAGPETPNSAKKSTSSNKKNIQNKENMVNGICSPKETNGVHENKPSQANAGQRAAKEHLHGEPGSPDDMTDNKPGEAIPTKCQSDVKENLDAGKAHPNDASEENSLPDPIFHSFESEKSEDKMKRGQIWALYSSQDGGLPKYYARINKVKSQDSKVLINWLDACPVSEKENWWSKKELPVGCGTFELRTGETEVFEMVGPFSHRMTINAKNGFLIFPRKGEVWAIYKNWRADWTFTDLKHCEYEMVEILNSGDLVIEVRILEMAGGFKTIYKNAGVEIDVPRDELLRFSHLVPSFRLTNEKGGKLKDCFELDPKALPDFSFL